MVQWQQDLTGTGVGVGEREDSVKRRLLSWWGYGFGEGTNAA